MSFSSEVKEELSKLSNLANKNEVKAELIGYLMGSNCSFQNNCIRYSTENEYNINRFGKLLSNAQCMSYQIDMSGKNFVITFEVPWKKWVLLQEGSILPSEETKQEILKEEITQKAFIRGCFLGSGSINNPHNTYHFEITFSCLENANMIMNILQKFAIYLKQIPKKKDYTLYTKEGEEISKLLAFMNANHAVLKFEEIRVYRDMRNHINRKVNCETANLNKTVEAALKQIEAIHILQKQNRLKNLPLTLQEIATLRIEHPEASLAELGSMLKKPIGKSGVNHRLKAIEKLAKE